MQDSNKAPTAAAIDRREIRATLGVGLFTNGVWDMLSIVVPLYGVAVGLSAAEIGLIVAARSILPTALSIHGGILMDQWGTRRILLWLAAGCTVLPLAFPVASAFSVLFVLQLLLGLASALGMSAGQTWSLQASHGDVSRLAQFSIVSRIGTFLGPVMVGAAWDLLGAWAAFGLIAVWGAAVAASAAYVPARAVDASAAPHPRPLAALIPRWTEHKAALALAAIPAVAFVLGVSYLRNAPGAIQSSLYVVYLGEVGISGTLIGTLVAVCELFGVVGSMIAARLERVMRAHWLVVICIVFSTLAIVATPLLAHAFILLTIASAVRGIAQGISQPLMYSILGRAVPATVHGASVGLRNAVTRFASIITPAVMGIVAEVWGLAASFLAVGVMLMIGTAVLAYAARRVFGNVPRTAAVPK